MVEAIHIGVNPYRYTLPDCTEEDQLVAMAQDRPEAFALLYDRYYDRIFPFLLRRCRNRQTAEDLTADTFMKALKSIRSYKTGEATFLAWLFRIANNTLVSHYRKEKVRRLFFLYHSNINQEEPSTPALAPHIVDFNHVEKRISEFFQTLPLPDQTILVLRYYENVSIKEIAYITNLSYGNVRIRIHRALTTLREAIQKQEPQIAELILGEPS